MTKARDILILDTDNTLYPPECGLLESMKERILNSLRTHEGLKEKFSAVTMQTLRPALPDVVVTLKQLPDGVLGAWEQDIYNLDYSVIEPNPRLVKALHMARAAGIELFIYSNSPVFHVQRVLECVGLPSGFMADSHICGALQPPKPSQEGFDLFLKTFGINPGKAVFVDDGDRNLPAAKARRVKTVLLDNKSNPGPVTGKPDLIVTDVAEFIDNMAAQRLASRYKLWRTPNR